MHLLLSIRVVAEASLVSLVRFYCNDLGAVSMATWLKKVIKVRVKEWGCSVGRTKGIPSKRALDPLASPVGSPTHDA